MLPVTLIFVCAIVAITSFIYVLAAMYVPYQRTFIAQEKAYQLAMGGVQIACSQLARTFESESPSKSIGSPLPANASPLPEAQQYAHILSSLDMWQTITLNRPSDHISGQIKICITPEDGKININQIYDFSRHLFADFGSIKGGWRNAMMDMFKRIEKNTGASALFAPFEHFLKQHSGQLNDLTELLAIPEFSVFSNQLFYKPAIQKNSSNESKQKKTLYLTDLFTIHTSKKLISPWLFSSSLLELFDLSRNNVIGKTPDLLLANELKEFKKSGLIGDLWSKIFTKIYGKGLQSLPKNIESVLDTIFEPQLFCIYVHGLFGTVTQQICVIVERRQSTNRGAGSKKHFDVVIKRLYRI